MVDDQLLGQLRLWDNRLKIGELRVLPINNLKESSSLNGELLLKSASFSEPEMKVEHGETDLVSVWIHHKAVENKIEDGFSRHFGADELPLEIFAIHAHLLP